MILRNLSVYYSNNQDPFYLRFHQGTKDFPQSYYIIGQADLYHQIVTALEYSILGLNSGHSIIEQSQLSLADDAGNSWQIKRKFDRYTLFKNQERVEIDTQKFFHSIFKQLSDSELVLPKINEIGKYHLSKKENEFYVSSVNHASKEEIYAHKLISQQRESLLEACQLSLDLPAPPKEEDLATLCGELKTLHSSYKELSIQLNKIYENKDTLPRETSKEIKQYTDQLEIMDSLANIIDDVLQVAPKANELKDQLIRTENKIKENLEYCKLDAIPDKHFSFDWNVPLHCLCYLNVLDKMIPVLKQSLIQFQNNIDGSAQDIKCENEKFVKLKNLVLEQIEQCKHSLSRTPLTSLNEQDFSRFQKYRRFISQIFAWDDPLNKAYTRRRSSFLHEEQEIFKYLNQISETLSQYEMNGKLIHSTPVALEKFLEQIANKKSTLKKHWDKIREELNFSESLGLDEFLQYVLKYNELFILKQSVIEIKQKLELKNKNFEKLKSCLQLWYDETGSQKVATTDNYQLILNEAQNILRYRKGKKAKLEFVLENRIQIEVNHNLKKHLHDQLAQIKEQWTKSFQISHMPVLAQDDDRVVQILDIYSLIKSLNILENNISSLKWFPASSNSWPYEFICIWKIPFINQDHEQIESLLNCLKLFSQQSLHLLFFRDSKLNPYLKREGLGQVLVIKGEREEEIKEDIRRTSATSSLTLNTSSVENHEIMTEWGKLEKRVEKRTAKNSQKVPVKVQAVVDLLNGTSQLGK